MDVRTALTVGELARAEVLAGQEGIEREITGADVMEVPDINGWFRGGLLVISTFYSVKDSTEAQVKTIKTLIDAGCAGLVVKVGRYVKELPDEMFELADKRDFPLISIPLDISFVDILSVLYEHLYQEQSDKEDKEAKWNQLFQEFMSKNIETTQSFVNEISLLTHANVYVEDKNGRLLCAALNRPDSLRKTFTLFSPASRKEPLTQRVNPIKQENDTITLHDRFIIPVNEGKTIVAFLHILYDDKKTVLKLFGERYMRLKQRLHLIMIKEQYSVEKCFLQDQSFLNEQRQELQEYQLLAMNVSLLNHFQLDSFTELNLLADTFWSRVSQFTARNYPGVRFTVEEEYLYAYLPHNNFSFDQRKNKIKAFLHFLNDLFVFHFRAGVSLTHQDLTDFDVAVGEAKLALNTSESEKNVVFYEYVGVNRILLRLKSDPDLQHFSNMTIHRLRKESNDEQLVETIDAYLKENGNNSKTAERLFIHRRTLSYRLEKIEQLLNVDLNDSDTRFLLYLLLKVETI